MKYLKVDEYAFYRNTYRFEGATPYFVKKSNRRKVLTHSEALALKIHPKDLLLILVKNQPIDD